CMGGSSPQPAPTTTRLERSGMGGWIVDLWLRFAQTRRRSGSHCAMFQRVLAFEPRLRHETPGVGMLFGGGAAAMLGRLLRRTAVGRAPAQAKELDRTCVRQGPADPLLSLYRIWGLFPLNSDC